MYSDYHVHSAFSNDSKSVLRDICMEAVKKGMQSICITDHIDAVNPQRMNDLREVERFFNEFEPLRREFSGQLCLKAGFEFSEPAKNIKLYEKMLEYPFTYHMCSVHHCSNGLFPSPDNIEIFQAIHEYLKNVKENIELDKIDGLGHIDLIRRYYGAFPFVEEELREIFKIMVQRNILLEVNTSCFLRSTGVMPNYIDYLQDYIAIGGVQIVMGSDAHKISDIGCGFEQLILDRVTVME